eukprot:807855_1
MHAKWESYSNILVLIIYKSCLIFENALSRFASSIKQERCIIHSLKWSPNRRNCLVKLWVISAETINRLDDPYPCTHCIYKTNENQTEISVDRRL